MAPPATFAQIRRDCHTEGHTEVMLPPLRLRLSDARSARYIGWHRDAQPILPYSFTRYDAPPFPVILREMPHFE